MSMRRLLMIALSTWLVWPGCADAERDLPRAYRRVDVPAALLASADARTRGSRLFHEHCALCHGDRGDGQGVRRHGLTRAPRDFTDPGWRASTTPRRVFFAIREGLPGTPMPGWKALSEQDAWTMTAYVLSLADPQ
jgi:mono/diheme cytochrome c family protein